MRHWFLPAIAALALTGCGIGRPAGPPDTPEQAECRREARSSQAVRDLRRTVTIGANDRIVQIDIAAAEERAFRNCLRERRLPGAGGVEAPAR